MKLAKLPRNPIRPEKEPCSEVEIWQPSWQCFCCHDTGIIATSLAALIIDEYDYNRDRLPRCVNPGCKAGDYWDSEALTDCIDYRISAATCQKLDVIERENWRKTVQRAQINIQALAQKMSLRQRARTPAEQIEAVRRHEELCHADSAFSMRKKAQEYLGTEYLKNGSE